MPERTLIARRPMTSDDVDDFAAPDPFDRFDSFDSFDSFEPSRSHRRAWLVGGGALVVAVLVAGGALLMRGGSGQGKVNAAVLGLPSTTAAPAVAHPPAAPIAATAATAAPTSAAAPVTAPATTAAPVASSAATSPPPTLPDGSWPPVTVTFDTNQVTLTGAVPSTGAADRLRALAAANSKTKAPVKDTSTVDPRVPANVGVRVVELTSTRFPSGSAAVLPAHALELDRVVNMMKAAPNITLVVIGHADQRGTSDENLALSGARAQAVVDYLAAHGIDVNRLGSKAVGADDPLTQSTSQAALALNRRTEFVFYGLLVGA